MLDTDLWQSIVGEARRAVAADPAYGTKLAWAILNRSGLADAIGHQIAVRLGDGSSVGAQLEAASRQAFAAEPAIIEAATKDLDAIVASDPASPGLLPVLLNFKGYLALQAWRVSNWLWRQDRRNLALLFQSASSGALQVSIHPSAEIGAGVFLDHGTGIVIGPFASIGDNVTILQSVTIGRKADRLDQAPRIGRGVLLGSGAMVIGPIHVGDLAKVGAGALVDRDVPAGCTAVGDPMRLTNCGGDQAAA
jgi:serine O-acetyltransferase